MHKHFLFTKKKEEFSLKFIILVSNTENDTNRSSNTKTVPIMPERFAGLQLKIWKLKKTTAKERKPNRNNTFVLLESQSVPFYFLIKSNPHPTNSKRWRNPTKMKINERNERAKTKKSSIFLVQREWVHTEDRNVKRKKEEKKKRWNNTANCSKSLMCSFVRWLNGNKFASVAVFSFFLFFFYFSFCLFSFSTVFCPIISQRFSLFFPLNFACTHLFFIYIS